MDFPRRHALDWTSVIRYLAIRNLAVIESVAVEFEQSFNILTGETGAGKSILVEAVGLLLGGRASQDLVRTGEELATVEAIFEDRRRTEIVVRREITAQGRSRAFISGALATAGALKDLSDRLVELHGQHEHQQLLDPDQHLPLLDAGPGSASRSSEVATRVSDRRADSAQQLDRAADGQPRTRRPARARRVSAGGAHQRPISQPARTRSWPRCGRSCGAPTRSSGCARRATPSLYEAEESVLTRLGPRLEAGRRAGRDRPAVRRPTSSSARRIKAQLEDLAFTLRDFGESDRRVARPARAGRGAAGAARAAEAEARPDARRGDRQARRAGRRARGADRRRRHAGGRVEQELAAASATLPRAGAGALGGPAQGRGETLRRRTRSASSPTWRWSADPVRGPADDPTSSESRWSERGIDAGEFYLSPNPGEDSGRWRASCPAASCRA